MSLSSNFIKSLSAEYREVFVYYFIDEYLKNCGFHIETKCSASGTYPKLYDAEIIFIFTMSFSYFGGNYQKSMNALYNAGFIKNKLSKGQFSARIYKLYPFIYQIFGLLAQIAKDCNQKYALDTFPIALCHNIRIKRCKILKEEVYRGYNASKRVFFYGFKVHLITSFDGTVTEFEFSPGSVPDSAGYNLLNFDLPAGSEVFLDKAYNFTLKEDMLRNSAHLIPMVIRKSNSKKDDNTYLQNRLKQLDRKHIETDISLIERLFPGKIHVTNVQGFFLKMLGFILAYNLSIFFEQSIKLSI